MLSRLICWLQEYNGAVIAAAAVIYTITTVALWWQTRRQAVITKSMFEASQRPYLSIEHEWSLESMRDLMARFDLQLRNHGTLPGVVTGWKIAVDVGGRASIKEQKGRDEIGLCMFPQQRGKIGLR